ncbi:MAG: c-type cytochrome [Pseudomonadota bacterium]
MNLHILNKVAGAFLGALLLFLLLGFFSEKAVRGEKHHEDVLAFALDIEVPDAGGEEGEEVVEEVIDLAALVPGADLGNGEKIFRQCSACHKIQDGANGVGPHLWNVVGREIGAVGAYSYSGALADRGGVWDLTNLSGFLEKPADWAPGTRMGYSGLKDPQDRVDVIAYLNEEGESFIELAAAPADTMTDTAVAEAPAVEATDAAAEPGAAEAEVTETAEAEIEAEAEAGTEVTEAPADTAAADTAETATTDADEASETEAAEAPAEPEATETADATAEAETVVIAAAGEDATTEPAKTAATEASTVDEPAEETAETGPAEASVDEEAAEAAAETEAAEASTETETEAPEAAATEAEASEETMEVAVVDTTTAPEPEPEAPAVESIFASVSAADGAKVFRQCAACHVADKEQNRVGPYLLGVVGRDVASIDGYRYSSALTGHGGVWSPDRLAEYLENPMGVVKGTKMSFRGLRNEEDRLAVIKWLNENSPNPIDLP